MIAGMAHDFASDMACYCHVGAKPLALVIPQARSASAIGPRRQAVLQAYERVGLSVVFSIDGVLAC